MVQLHKIS